MGIQETLKGFFKRLNQSPNTSTYLNNELEPQLQKIIKEVLPASAYNYWHGTNLGKSDTFNKIQKEGFDTKKELVVYLITRINALRISNRKNHNYGSLNNPNRIQESAFQDILKGLLRRDLNLTAQEIYKLLLAFKDSDEKARVSFFHWPVPYVIQQVERKAKKAALSPEMTQILKEILTWNPFANPTKNYYGTDREKIKIKVEKLLFEAENKSGAVAPYSLPEDGLGVYINKTVNDFDTALQDPIFELFHLFLKASASKPSASFLKKSASLIDQIGIVNYKNIVHDFLEVLIQLKVTEITHERGWVSRHFLEEKNNILIKGMIWSLARFHDTKTLNLVARTAERCFKKIPGVGPAAAAVGNACLYVLGNTRGLEGISHLSRLKLKIKQNNTRRLIEKLLSEASEKLGVSVSEIEEMSIPDFDLKKGKLNTLYNDYQFIIQIEDIGKISTIWVKPDGKTQKSIPSFVKDSAILSAKLKKQKATVQKIKKYLTAQRDRIDRIYLDNRTWSYENLSKFYLNHGLVSCIAQKLLWEVRHGNQWQTVYFKEATPLDFEDKAVPLAPDSVLRLWHPCNVSTERVLEWRKKLDNLEVKQPIKQVYREVYILTDAEINTKSYSNRMAAHILKQHQFNALAALRGWKYSLMGAFDNGIDSEMATLNLNAHNLEAQFWINELNTDDAYNDTGIWLYVATDQVRFVNSNREAVDLVDIPPVVFSEVMRNVDLFVGVASVGNDPEWSDNGGLPQYRNYWMDYSFGDLSEIAKTRKTILENLLPRLKINKVSKIEGKYLLVKGKVRQYKIHIGSSNILMEPNDQYLCIVADRSASKAPANVFLPFEGDKGLSLVLSKAFLLAADDKIKDPTILSQIHRK